ncbi:MAG: BadF/BadG/BcrA/BcrD ATPase family protein [Longimicrobiaceae bacterium]
MNRFVVGVDGGGTRTRLALADLEGKVLHRLLGGPGLVDPKAPGTTVREVAALAREAADRAGVSLPAVALCAGLAGAGSTGLRDRVAAGLAREGLAGNVKVIGDGEVALAAAFGGDAGVLLIAGTGSVVYGRSEDGRTARCGGWGAALGDGGSGYAIGLGAVRQALRSADGMAPETRLLPALLGRLEADGVVGLAAWANAASKAEVAALAPLVLSLAEEGDDLARSLVENGVRDLALHAVVLAGRLEPWSGPVPVALHGGLFEERGVTAAVAASIRAKIDAEVRHSEVPPVLGALECALRLAGVEKSPTFTGRSGW